MLATILMLAAIFVSAAILVLAANLVLVAFLAHYFVKSDRKVRAAEACFVTRRAYD